MNSSRLSVLLSSIIFLATLVTQAQNYSYFDPARTRSYGIEGERYFFIEINETQIDGTDTTYFFKRRVDTLAEGCDATTDNYDIIGPKVKIRGDSVIYFYNKNSDSIKFLKYNPLFVPWVAYTFPDGKYITGTFTNFGYGQLMPDIYDSIRVIRYNVYDQDGNLLPDSVPNAWNIDIAKNFGLFEFINFNNFPYDTTNFKMRGLSDPDTGTIFDVTAKRAFDYLLGSEFHYREVAVPDNESDADKRISAWKYFVLEKSLTPSSATYTMERVRFDTLYNGITPSSTITWDTVEVIYNYADYAVLDSIELLLLQQENFGFADWIKEDSLYQAIPHKHIYSWFNYDPGENCLNNPGGSDQPEQLYGEGLGLMHYQDSVDGGNYYSFNMVYFQKGLLTWGTPYDFTDLDLQVESIKTNLFHIYPNPAINLIVIGQAGFAEFTYVIYSPDGRLIISGNGVGQTNSVDLSGLPAGIYQLSVYSESGFESHRFVKAGN